MSAPSSSEKIATLYRGCQEKQGRLILSANTAGGEPADKNCGRPDEEQAKRQAAGFSLQGFTNADRLPEYTTDRNLGFLRASPYILTIQIEAKYLTEGSRGEHGWVAYRSAPLTNARMESNPQYDPELEKSAHLKAD